MRVIVLLGSKVLFISWAFSGNICIPDLELIQLMFTRLPLEEIWIFGALCLYWCDVELHMYPIVVSGDSILGAKVSGFDFWRFILGAKVSVLISGDFHLERLFIWVSGRV